MTENKFNKLTEKNLRRMDIGALLRVYKICNSRRHDSRRVIPEFRERTEYVYSLFLNEFHRRGGYMMAQPKA